MNWDDEADVVCIGAGIGGLAAAVATVDIDGDVIVVASDVHIGVAAGAASGGDAARGWWQWPNVDGATAEYVSAFSDGLVSGECVDVGLAVRVARDLPSDGSSLAPFFGARLPEWTARCVTSPYGVFSSTVFGRFATPMQSDDGETIEVLSVGSIDWHDGLGEQALFDWMAAQVRDRGIEVREAVQLQRMVFEEGAVVGAVFSTSDGPYSVRTRYGLTVSPTEPAAFRSDAPAVTGAADRMQVCLVAHAGSRFARVELLATSSGEVVRQPVCMCSGRQVQEKLHQPRRVRSDAPRSGKVDGYPPRK